MKEAADLKEQEEKDIMEREIDDILEKSEARLRSK